MSEVEQSVGGVPIRRTPKGIQYLIIFTKKSKYWEFPKGHVELGETDEEALKRELKEETNITDFSVLPGFVHKFVFSPAAGRTQELRNFIVDIGKNKIVLDPEQHTEYKFVPYEDALSLFIFENLKTLLKEANDFLKHPSNKSH